MNDDLWNYWVYEKVWNNRDIFDEEEAEEEESDEEQSLEEQIDNILEPLRRLEEEWRRLD